MKKVFISQPMKDLTDGEIRTKRTEAINKIKQLMADEDIVILDTYFTLNMIENPNNPLEFLGKSIQVLGESDCAYFVNGWKDARGCVIEHMCAEQYGIEIIRD